MIDSYPVNLHRGHSVYWLIKAARKQDIHWFLRYIGCLPGDLHIVDFPDKLILCPFKRIDIEIICITGPIDVWNIGRDLQQNQSRLYCSKVRQISMWGVIFSASIQKLFLAAGFPNLIWQRIFHTSV